MEKIEVTSISSRGQVVIPQKLRETLSLHEGEKFIVIGEGDTIVLKKLGIPSFKGFDKLLKKTREFAREKQLEERNVEEAIKRTRKK